MSEVKKLVVSDYEIPHSLINKIMASRSAEKSLYDIISFPYLIETLVQAQSILENYFLYLIKKMLRMHPIENILFIVNRACYDPFLAIRLEREFFFYKQERKIHIDVITYQIESDTISLYEMHLKHNYPIKDKIIFRCSDGRLSKIYAESLAAKNNPLDVKDGYYICLPGSTMPLTDSEERKALLKLIMFEIKSKPIKEIIIEHHSDCGAVKNFNLIFDDDIIDEKRSFMQHIVNIELAWKKFLKNEINISARYIELRFHTNTLAEWKFTHENGISTSVETKIIPFDFCNLQFAENKVLVGINT